MGGRGKVWRYPRLTSVLRSLTLLLWNYFSWSTKALFNIPEWNSGKNLLVTNTFFPPKKLFNDIRLKTFISLYACNLDILTRNVRKRASGPKVHPVLDAKWRNRIPCLRLTSLKTTQNSTVSDSIFKDFLGVFFSFSGKWVKYAGAREGPEGHVPRHSLLWM